MIAGQPNTLILDETTNYISPDVIYTLETAITNFQGPTTAASRKYCFIENIGGDIRVLFGGKLEYNPGEIKGNT